ncbi:MAG: NUDIX hydrolase [Candidatus Levybacteria bacterium]|nr:NUDIX hydrolase [Candidatus Levybacteria bacterium]
MDRQVVVFAGLLQHQGKILMGLRKEPELSHAHMRWEFPGGKSIFGEDPKDTVKREFLEETGIIVDVGELIPYVQNSIWKYEHENVQSLCFAFHCTFISQGVFPQDHHVEKIDWFSIEEVLSLPSLPGTKEMLVGAGLI